MQQPFAIELKGVGKRFPGVVANEAIDMQVPTGGFHAIIGENGAGKSTLLNILYGRLQADTGRILHNGVEITQSLHSPSDAIKRGIGLVSQHFSLIPALSVRENIVLGAEPTGVGGIFHWNKAEARIAERIRLLGIEPIDLTMRAGKLTVAQGQKVEILKALYRDAKILLLDEPTATLAPSEAQTLFALLQRLQQQGTTIIFVTHKLREVLDYSQSVTALRHGKVTGTFITSQTNEMELLSAMLGRQVTTPETGVSFAGGHIPKNPNTFEPSTASPILLLDKVSIIKERATKAVDEASLEVFRGEILGVAGVDGSGQPELIHAIIGLRAIHSGSLRFQGWNRNTLEDISGKSVQERQRLGIAYIPEDRRTYGMMPEFSLVENYLLGSEANTERGGGTFLNLNRANQLANEMLSQYDVRVGNRDATVLAKNLSGGNQQKVVFARAIASDPCLIVACQPTRGLDIEASRYVYQKLLEARNRNIAVLMFSLDLEEILNLSDRVAVMFNGKIVEVLQKHQANHDTLGSLMTTGSR